jgi:two-component system sensor histidine kinase PilS (NtrC family)
MAAVPQENTGPAPAAPEEVAYILEDSAFVRLWQGLMTARVMVALALLILLATMYQLTRIGHPWLLALCAAYLGQTVAVRLLARPRPPGNPFDAQWILTIGVDLVVFCSLEFGQVSGVNYTPLFAIPVLIAAVMGSSLLALGTASGVTLVLLGNAYIGFLRMPSEAASIFAQAGLTGTGYLILAFLINQLASRLSGEEQSARRSQRAARIQTQVNELVIEFLEEGVLVVDSRGLLRAVNPAARRLLGWVESSHALPALHNDASAHPLFEVARQTFERGQAQAVDITVAQGRQGRRPIHARTRLTTSSELQTERLCVIFLQDLREMEAKIRTEKLAAMGRMSTAVAHEIRNPLAAISQANALLDEDLTSPAHRRLTAMVRQNTRRLSQIVEEVLDISRVQRQPAAGIGPRIGLNGGVQAACEEWARQTGNTHRLQLALDHEVGEAAFDGAHLQRLLVNLLDNASRYAGGQRDSIQVSTTQGADGGIGLQVWSDGQPLEPGVHSHLFEPFFSSESRSTGLGLYICRELCERHGASIGYQRVLRPCGAASVEGNEFFVGFRRRAEPGTAALAHPMIAA